MPAFVTSCPSLFRSVARPGAVPRRICRHPTTIIMKKKRPSPKKSANTNTNTNSNTNANVDASDMKQTADEMVRRDMETLKAKRAKLPKKEENSVMTRAKDAISTVLIVDFFLIVAILVWLAVALVPHFASKNDTLLDPWLQLWGPVFQPLLGILMAATIVQGTISYISGDANNNSSEQQ